MKKLTRHLLSSSQEAFVLALEIYNKPTIQYRVESFCFLFCNGWELLLKARILELEKKETAIYYKKKKGYPKRTISLRDCLQKTFVSEKDPIRRNVEDIAEIRDSATHFIIPELEVVYQGLLQAGVINYVQTLENWFGVSVLEKCTPALLSLVADIGDTEPAKLRKKYGKDILDFVEREEIRLNKAEKEIDNSKYRIPIEYKLVLTKSPGEADIALSSGQSERIGLVVNVPKDPSKTHPYLQSKAIEEINERLNDRRINSYDFQAFLHKEKIKGQTHYHLKITNPEIHKYSEQLLSFFIEKVNRDEEYLLRARESYKSHQAKRREDRKQNALPASH